MLQKTLNPNRHEMYAFGYINVDFFKNRMTKSICQLSVKF